MFAYLPHAIASRSNSTSSQRSLRSKVRTFKKMARVAALRRSPPHSNKRISLSTLPDSVLNIIADYLEDAVTALPVPTPEQITEEQEEIFDEMFEHFFGPEGYAYYYNSDEEDIGDDNACDGYCCFPKTRATSETHRFSRGWNPEPIFCQRCKPEKAWEKMVLEWHEDYWQNVSPVAILALVLIQ